MEENIENRGKRITLPKKDLTDIEFNEYFVKAIYSLGFVLNETESGWVNVYRSVYDGLVIEFSVDDLFFRLIHDETKEVLLESDVMLSMQYMEGLFFQISKYLKPRV